MFIMRAVPDQSSWPPTRRPPPLIGKLLAPFCPNVLRVLAWALPRFGGDEGYLASLHRNEPGWKEACAPIAPDACLIIAVIPPLRQANMRPSTT